ncbi:MAG TPA: hypothetical protein VJ875_20675 [Pyrinomonadaceae bacterium]|nr:hypothetical protein [Pyrinomonadaceae bacterium]
MDKSACKYALPAFSFSNVLISDAAKHESVAFTSVAYNAGRKDLTNLSLFTNYRPNFCSECGEKIVRLRWRLWTSRRFCDKCSARFVSAQWLRRTLAVVALIATGLLIGRGWRQERPPLVIQRTASAPAQNSSGESSVPAAPVVAEQSYMCGARTKKGTPCSRRVHGPVRCWQHKGMPAMLPQDKLLIKE